MSLVFEFLLRVNIPIFELICAADYEVLFQYESDLFVAVWARDLGVLAGGEQWLDTVFAELLGFGVRELNNHELDKRVATALRVIPSPSLTNRSASVLA